MTTARAFGPPVRARRSRSVLASAFSIARVKDGASCAIATTPALPHSATTSAIGVEITGLPPARYSGVLVGLMNRVARFLANGSSASIPSGQIRRQRLVRLGAEIMDISAPRQRCLVDLGNRADYDELPIPPPRRQFREQVAVEPLVDDAEPAEPRVRDRAWSSGSGCFSRACAKCSRSTALGNR